ncbi:PREDICTED: uncharacterized protein LOC101299180 [Fragaria vesca subsp. vesca]|uniref:uncharacterized protein LOC101299180 n=1 Tax=Fragaria vesca subsp. vesca TaxID=101020 RepID=UPI0002C32BC1|nr:PREDICTED: uncharacterized protein LOC101299180 [Fragaria vesca subsp. vesca]
MATTATASFSLTKIAGFPPSSPTRSCSKVLAVKEGRGISGGMAVKARFGSSRGGAGVLERPKFDQTQFDPSTQLQEGGDIGRLKDKRGIGSGDSYRVLLIDDVQHTEKLVAKVLPQAVPSVTPDGARELFHKSREDGVAVVVVTVKEHAEFYSQMMIRGGLRSSIEPDSNSL